jgi:PadR family transcriptional regulator AphA
MSLRHALLGLLSDRPASGYDLLRLFETSLANVWSATQSQVYTELGKMAEVGLVSVSASGPRGRKEYEITEPGRAELRHWLSETRPTRTVRSEALLRVFFLGELPPEQAREYLRYLGAISAGQAAALEELDASVEWDQDDLSVYGRIALEYGKRFAAMRREWAEWAEGQLG